MIKSITAIIGANYGAEGKGWTANKLAKQMPINESILSVKAGGGPQSSKTVDVDVDGGYRRVVLRYLGGASTLPNAATHITQHTAVDIQLLVNDVLTLRQLGINPIVTIHKDCPIITPIDIAIDMVKNASHNPEIFGGTAGFGTHETVYRNSTGVATVMLTVGELIGMDHDDLRDKIRALVENYLPKRCQEVNASVAACMQLLSTTLADKVSAIKALMGTLSNYAFVVKDNNHISNFANVIFENPMGLLLDRDVDPVFSTSSKTDLTNVVDTLNDIKEYLDNIKGINVVYVTRPYVQKLGPGPFPTFTKVIGFPDDGTNITQSPTSMRYGYLDINSLCATIKHHNDVFSKVIQSSTIALTNTLQTLNIPVILNGNTVDMTMDEIKTAIENKSGMSIITIT